MKILLVSDFFPRGKDLKFSGGVEARTFFLAKNLSKNHQVTVICTRQQNTKPSEKMFGFKILRVSPEISYNSGAPSAFEAPKRLAFIIHAIKAGKQLDIDIVDGGNFNDHFIAKRIADGKNIPAVFWYPDVFIGQWIKTSGFLGGIVGFLLEKINLFFSADLFIAISKVTMNKLIVAGVDKAKVVTIPCGVEPNEFKQKVEKSKVPQIICISRLVSYKRVKDLIFAFALVERVLKEVRLVIVGNGPQKKELINLAKELNLLNKITFLENLSRQNLIKKIQESHIFALPSAVEGFGIATIESAAAGVPYVVSDISVFKEVTKNGQGGLLFNLGSPTDLAAKIKKLLVDKNLYQKKSEEVLGLSKIYDWSKIALATEKVYKSLIPKI